MRVPAAAAATVMLLAGAPSANQSGFSLEPLLDRGAAHVEALVRRLTRVVAEEQYLQEYLVAQVEGSRGNFKGSPQVDLIPTIVLHDQAFEDDYQLVRRQERTRSIMWY